jgi:hypothetical protein
LGVQTPKKPDECYLVPLVTSSGSAYKFIYLI